MIDVILNPKSIEFGVKKKINLYRLFEKIKILFGHLSNKKQDITIKIQSEGWVKDCYCYESIEFIPLILIFKRRYWNGTLGGSTDIKYSW